MFDNFYALKYTAINLLSKESDEINPNTMDAAYK